MKTKSRIKRYSLIAMSALLACMTAVALAACGSSAGTGKYGSLLQEDSSDLGDGNYNGMSYKAPKNWENTSWVSHSYAPSRDDGSSISVLQITETTNGNFGFPSDLDAYAKDKLFSASGSNSYDNVVRGSQGEAVTFTADYYSEKDGNKLRGKEIAILSGYNKYTYSVLFPEEAYSTYESFIDELIASAQITKPSAPSVSSTAATATDSKTASSSSDGKNGNGKSATSSATVSQRNALQKAKSYLNSSDFSYEGLIKQLEYNKFSNEDATYAADNCGADWNAEAVGKAKSYISSSAFSYTGLIEQLQYNGFTEDQATHGADNCGADWMAQAAKKAESYMKTPSFSRDSLINQLEFNGFTEEQAAHGADSVGL